MGDKGLDFEKALRGPEFDRWIDRDELNRQHLAALEGVRKEEREKWAQTVASAYLEGREQAREEAFREMREFCAINDFPFPVKFDKEVG